MVEAAESVCDGEYAKLLRNYDPEVDCRLAEHRYRRMEVPGSVRPAESLISIKSAEATRNSNLLR
jgi:hypothetical protein